MRAVNLNEKYEEPDMRDGLGELRPASGRETRIMVTIAFGTAALFLWGACSAGQWVFDSIKPFLR